MKRGPCECPAHPCVVVAASVVAIVLAWTCGLAGCGGGGEKMDRGAAHRANGVIENDGNGAGEVDGGVANAGTMSAPVRVRDLPRVDARSAARQVALMAAVDGATLAGRIDLLAEAYRLAIESDAGANGYYLLVAGAGVELESPLMDAHEFALRILAPLGTLTHAVVRDSVPQQEAVPPDSVRRAAIRIAWAPIDVQDQLRHRESRDDASMPPIRAQFPGTRNLAALVTVAIDQESDERRLRGTVTIESPDGRTARQGFEALRDENGNGWRDIGLTGVRIEW